MADNLEAVGCRCTVRKVDLEDLRRLDFDMVAVADSFEMEQIDSTEDSSRFKTRKVDMFSAGELIQEYNTPASTTHLASTYPSKGKSQVSIKTFIPSLFSSLLSRQGPLARSAEPSVNVRPTWSWERIVRRFVFVDNKTDEKMCCIMSVLRVRELKKFTAQLMLSPAGTGSMGLSLDFGPGEDIHSKIVVPGRRHSRIAVPKRAPGMYVSVWILNSWYAVNTFVPNGSILEVVSS